MAFELKAEAAGERIVRRDYADVDAQRRHVAQLRDLNNGRRRRDPSDPFNEAFSFTADAWELTKKTNPELHDPDAQRRAKAWRAFASSSIGQAFRVK